MIQFPFSPKITKPNPPNKIPLQNPPVISLSRFTGSIPVIQTVMRGPLMLMMLLLLLRVILMIQLLPLLPHPFEFFPWGGRERGWWGHGDVMVQMVRGTLSVFGSFWQWWRQRGGFIRWGWRIITVHHPHRTDQKLRSFRRHERIRVPFFVWKFKFSKF